MLTWQKAEERCESENAFLVTIDNSEENQFVRNISAQNDVWIGLHDMSQEGNFVWISNSTSLYRSWSRDEPNNDGGVEDCAHMLASSTLWNDLPCGVPSPYVCERGEHSLKYCHTLIYITCLFVCSSTTSPYFDHSFQSC